MRRSRRLLFLPAAAVLLPCLFIGALSVQWLEMERQAAAHRNAEAAERLVEDLRRDLATELSRSADTVARALARLPPDRPAFQPPPPLAALVSDAYLFDRSAEPPESDGNAPASAGDGLQPESGAAGSDQGRSALAASILTRAQRALAAGRTAAAGRLAAGIQRCCPGARDEYGMSFAVYAAWLRVVAAERQARRGEALEEIGQELRGLVETGHLGAASDATQLALLAARAQHAASLASLVPLVERIAKEAGRREEMGRLAAQWVQQASLRHTEGTPVLIGTLGRDASATMAALSRASDGRPVVMMVDHSALERWITEWAGERRRFLVDVRPPEPFDGRAGALRVPLFGDVTTSPTLVLTQEAARPAADRTRRHLFGAAVVGVVVLTILIGYLAARDVSRELSTAALRSTFVAGVTHELKTPLASIRLLAETVRHGRTRPETRDELLDTIVEETDRLGRLVDNVLSSSRIESGTPAYNAQPVSLPDAVRSALERFRYVLKQEGFTAELRIDCEPTQVEVDPDAFGQSVLNLLSNAVKYSGSSRAVRLAIDRRGEFAVVSVADNGTGIAPADRERIFESFYRVPQSARDTTGAGLGLALVRHFAEAHGGRVTVESQPGRGSEFSIFLPVRRPNSGEPVLVRAANAEAVGHG